MKRYEIVNGYLHADGLTLGYVANRIEGERLDPVIAQANAALTMQQSHEALVEALKDIAGAVDRFANIDDAAIHMATAAKAAIKTLALAATGAVE